MNRKKKKTSSGDECSKIFSLRWHTYSLSFREEQIEMKMHGRIPMEDVAAAQVADILTLIAEEEPKASDRATVWGIEK